MKQWYLIIQFLGVGVLEVRRMILYLVLGFEGWLAENGSQRSFDWSWGGVCVCDFGGGCGVDYKVARCEV